MPMYFDMEIFQKAHEVYEIRNNQNQNRCKPKINILVKYKKEDNPLNPKCESHSIHCHLHACNKKLIIF